MLYYTILCDVLLYIRPRPSARREEDKAVGAKYYAPEITGMKLRWNMPLRVHWTTPVRVHLENDIMLESPG